MTAPLGLGTGTAKRVSTRASPRAAAANTGAPACTACSQRIQVSAQSAASSDPAVASQWRSDAVATIVQRGAE